MRLRTLTAGLALAAGAAGLPTGTAAAANPPLRATITCDEATGTISTAAAGGTFAAGQPVTVRFEVHQGSSVPAGGTTGRTIPQQRTVTDVPTRTLADGSIAAAGYRRPWRAADHAFYTETVRLHVRTSPTGSFGFYGQATCTRDTRTALTHTCDPATRTSAARITGSRYAAGAPVRVEYRLIRMLTQAKPGDPAWVMGPITYAGPNPARTVTADATGTWSDPGYVRQQTAYRYEETIEVTVLSTTGVVVGRGDSSCAYTAA